MMVRWRERKGKWSNTRKVSLGAVGKHDAWVELRGLGMYRSRQYEFIHPMTPTGYSRTVKNTLM